MIYKFTISNELAGTKVISEPQGWKDAVCAAVRHPVFYYPVIYFESAFSFYGSNGVEDGGRDWCLSVWSEQGPDALIEILVEYSDVDDEYDLKTMFQGCVTKLPAVESIDFTHDLQVSFDPSDFWTKFISRIDTPVNLLSDKDLDGNTLTPVGDATIKLPCQPINKITSYTGHTGDELTVEDCYVMNSTSDVVAFSGHQLIDGVMTIDGMRILLIGTPNVSPAQAGVWIASSDAWYRALDCNSALELTNCIVKVTAGTQAGKTFKQTQTITAINVDFAFFDEWNYVDDTLLFNYGGRTQSSTTLQTLVTETPATAKMLQSEISDSFEVPFVMTNPAIGQVVANILEVNGERGNILFGGDISIGLLFDAQTGSFDDDNILPERTLKALTVETNVYYQINSDTRVLLTTGTAMGLLFNSTSGWPTSSLGITVHEKLWRTITGGVKKYDLVITIPDTTIAVSPSDVVRIIIEYTAKFRYQASVNGHDEAFVWLYRDLYGGIISNNLQFKFASETPDTTTGGFLLHDAFANVVERIIGSGNRFYSEVLGSVLTRRRTYPVDGDHWSYGVMPGLQIKQYTFTEKPFAPSLMDLVNGAFPIFNLALKPNKRDLGDGFTVDTIEVVKKKDAYDSSGISIVLYNVRKIKKSLDPNGFPNRVVTGYEEWKSSDTQSIDDPQAVQTRVSGYKRIGVEFKQLSKFIAASLAIEKIRRLPKSNKNQDNQYDDKIFIISLNRESTTFTPSLDEKFTSVSGLLNEDRRYNKDLTPARAVLRWMNVLVGGLQSLVGTALKFASGEGNFAMVSTMVDTGLPEQYNGAALSEKANIPIEGEFLYIPEVYEIEHVMTLDEWVLYSSNLGMAIGISQDAKGDGEVTAFAVDELRFNPPTGTVKIKARTKEPFEIKVFENDSMEHELIPGRVFSDEFDTEFS